MILESGRGPNVYLDVIVDLRILTSLQTSIDTRLDLRMKHGNGRNRIGKGKLERVVWLGIEPRAPEVGSHRFNHCATQSTYEYHVQSTGS